MLVGRAFELSLVNDSLQECFRGNGGILAVTGPVGSGKTYLLRAAAAEAVAAGARYESTDALRAERNVPLGALSRLLTSANLDAGRSALATRLLDDVLLSAAVYDRGEPDLAPAVASLLDRLTSILIDLAQEAPLVIGIDDAHLLDEASMQGLLYLAQHIRTERVLVLVNESSSFQRRQPLLWAELLSQPNCRFLGLDMLSPDGVGELIDQSVGLPDACCPTICHDLSGGNPRLVNALLDDYRLGRVPGTTSAAATSFGQGVLTSLLRGDPAMLPMARALAVLDAPATPAQLSEMLGVDVAATTWAVEAASAAGLLAAGQLRHDCSRQALLELTNPEERMELHRSAAEVLYRNGAPAVAVARHKLAAHHADTPWSNAVLREAAEHALEEGNTGLALNCLRLAEKGTSPGERAEIQAAIVRAKWRVDPVTVERDLDELLAAEREGNLTGHDAIMLARQLSWCGRPADAADLLGRLEKSGIARDEDLAIALSSARAYLSYAYPERFNLGDVGSAPETPVATAVAFRPDARAAGLRVAVMNEGFSKMAIEDAQVVLQHSQLDDYTHESILTSLDTLVQADCLGKAAYWCDALLSEAEERRAPTWSAYLSAVRAMVSYRQGDLADAERHGRAALGRISRRGFGIFIGMPLSVLMLVDSRSGRYDAAQGHLRVRVPDAMFQTPVGLHYLRARGRYYLARRYYRSAIEDFKVCGELMMKWNLDLPGIIPWRTDLAEAYLRLGQPAEQIARDQLAILGSYNRRTRGMSLRVLAAASELRRRVPLLREAVEMLQSSGDRLEFCDALIDLSEAQYALGEYTKARLTAQRAKQLQTHLQGGAAPPSAAEVSAASQATTPRLQGTNGTGGEDLDILKLSDAERRVASLAAQGQTNRQIAGNLFITVSTVEQHLTRVYRKLEIKRRADLPYGLLSGSIAI